MDDIRTAPAGSNGRARPLAEQVGYFIVDDDLVTAGWLAVVTGAAVKVYVALRHHRHRKPGPKYGRAWPGLSLLSTETGLSRGTVSRALQDLVAAGVIEQVPTAEAGAAEWAFLDLARGPAGGRVLRRRNPPGGAAPAQVPPAGGLRRRNGGAAPAQSGCCASARIPTREEPQEGNQKIPGSAALRPVPGVASDAGGWVHFELDRTLREFPGGPLQLPPAFAVAGVFAFRLARRGSAMAVGASADVAASLASDVRRSFWCERWNTCLGLIVSVRPIADAADRAAALAKLAAANPDNPPLVLDYDSPSPRWQKLYMAGSNASIWGLPGVFMFRDESAPHRVALVGEAADVGNHLPSMGIEADIFRWPQGIGWRWHGRERPLAPYVEVLRVDDPAERRRLRDALITEHRPECNAIQRTMQAAGNGHRSSTAVA